MNVLFVYSLDNGVLPNGLLSSQELIQFGISQIASCLRRAGHFTELVVMSRQLGRRSIAAVKRSLDEVRPGLICFSAVATQYEYIAGIAAGIKRERPDIFLLAGGVHPTLDPNGVIADAFDAVCVGEGEQPTVELADALAAGRKPALIPNLWIKRDGAVEKNPPRHFMQDLDALPFPDRSLWQRWMADKSPRMCSLLLSRGCPFDCSYCSNHALRKAAPGVYVRRRSPDTIARELIETAAAFPSLREIYLETETLLSAREWCLELCARLSAVNASLHAPLSYGANIRIVPGAQYDDVFSAMRAANFRFVNIGLESGSERVRRDILRRNYSNGDVLRAVESARAHGLKIALFNLIGVPGETFEDFKETVAMNRAYRPDWHLTSIFFPYRGTDLYRTCLERRLFADPSAAADERRKAALALPGFTRRQVEEGLRYFNHYVYKGFDPDDRAAVRRAYFWDVTVRRGPKKVLRAARRTLHTIAGR